MRENIITEIIARLGQIGIEANQGETTDLVIDKEFLDAKWSTGEKKISYEASILVNEVDNTIYMHEKTTEVGSGFGFGMSTDSTVQSGSTLFRKVKAITYGPEGEVINIEIDLGAIPKTVKEIAKEKGYKFKTVIFKKKAQYVGGVRPVASNRVEPMAAPFIEKTVAPINDIQEQPLKQEASHQQDMLKSQLPKGLKIGITILSVITALFYLLLKVSLIGWILAILVIVGVFFWSKNIAKPVINVILLIVSFIVLFFVMAFNMNVTGTAGGHNMDNSKNINGFEINVPKPWIKPQPTMNVYQKVDNNIYSSFNVQMSNGDIDDSLYNVSSKEFEKYINNIKGYVKSEKIMVGKYEALKLVFDQKDVQVITYMYFINVPGKRDIMAMVASASKDTPKVAKECEGYLSNIKLTFEE